MFLPLRVSAIPGSSAAGRQERGPRQYERAKGQGRRAKEEREGERLRLRVRSALLIWWRASALVEKAFRFSNTKLVI